MGRRFTGPIYFQSTKELACHQSARCGHALIAKVMTGERVSRPIERGYLQPTACRFSELRVRAQIVVSVSPRSILVL